LVNLINSIPNSINLASGNGDINITGSNVSSINGDLNLNSMLGNINIKAGESTLSQSSKSNSRNLGGSIGTNGVSANIGFSEAQSSIDQTTFNNSQISAINGSLNINSANDTKIIGANLLASNVNMNIGNNLLLKSTQNLLESDSYNIGMSIGISGDSSGVGGGSLGLNLGNGYSNKAFVEDISSIIGTNSVNINVANDTNIAGALIANQNNQGIDLGNLNLKTKSLTYSDLNNFSVSESNQLGLNLQAGYNPNNPTQNGNLAINLNMQGRESSSTTKATIGKGNISIDEILNDETKIANLNRDINNIEQNKRDIITSDFDAELKIDLRLIASVGNLAVGDVAGAKENLGSYVGEVKDGWDLSFGYAIKKSNEIKYRNGEYPTLLPGLFRDNSKTGKDFYQGRDGLYREMVLGTQNLEIDPLINGDGKIAPTGIAFKDSQGEWHFNQYDSNPAFASLWQFVPIIRPFTKNHDEGVKNGLILPDQKASSIPSWLIQTTAGTIGTYINPDFYTQMLGIETKNNNIGDKNE
jgi:hypothetical protein